MGREAHGLPAERLGDALLLLGALDLLEQPQHDEVRVRELRQLRDVPLDLREDGKALLVVSKGVRVARGGEGRGDEDIRGWIRDDLLNVDCAVRLLACVFLSSALGRREPPASY